MTKLLIVEDDVDLASVVTQALESEGHAVEASHDGADAIERIRQYKYDLLILDWDLPYHTGLETCRTYRAAGGSSPVLFLTANSTLEAKEAGFDAGADDYLTKPFQLRELKARVKALLRRPPVIASPHLQVGDLEARLDERRVFCRGNEISLSPKEFGLLTFLMRHPGTVFSNTDILNSLWTSEDEIGTDTIRVHIKNIRAKIDKPGEPSMVRTVFGAGYKLEP